MELDEIIDLSDLNLHVGNVKEFMSVESNSNIVYSRIKSAIKHKKVNILRWLLTHFVFSFLDQEYLDLAIITGCIECINLVEDYIEVPKYKGILSSWDYSFNEYLLQKGANLEDWHFSKTLEHQRHDLTDLFIKHNENVDWDDLFRLFKKLGYIQGQVMIRDKVSHQMRKKLPKEQEMGEWLVFF